MDKAGRLVLPKWMRDKLQLKGGSKLRAEIRGDGIALEEEVPQTKIGRGKSGRRVVEGWEGFDAARAVREMREDQVARLEAPFRK